MDRRTRPPDVEEALSSMLWTPYERTPSVSSDEGEISPLRNSHPSVRTDCRRLTGEKKRYTQPIRYSFPHYGLIQPFSFNEPPSYENFVIAEKSVAAFATNSLPYLMPQFQMSPQPVMVHSFTDDFVQMQGSSTPLQQSNGVLPVRVSHPNQHQKQTETPSAVGNQTENQNRFSNDFSLLNLSVLTGRNYSNNNNLNNNHISNINSAVGVQTTQAAKTAKAAKATTVIEERTIIDQSRCCEENGNVGDLHFSKQGTFMATTTNHSVNVDSSTTAMTMETTTNIIADLPEEFRVSKPLLNQSLYTSSSSTSPSPSPSSSSRSRVLPALVEGQPNRATTTLLNCASATNVSRIRNLDDDVSPHETVLKYSESNSCNDDGVMRLNVPAATPPTEGGRTTSVYVPSRIISNGTLLGTVIVPQPSLTIQVNQSDQQQDVVNQPSGVSIVNCYRAVPVQIVNSVSDSGKNETVVQSTTTTTITPADRGSVIDGNANNQVGVSENLVNQSENSVSNQLDILRTDLERTFISTEAQTDDLQQEQEPVEANDNTNPPTSLSPTVTQITTEALISREQRRRERRERRQARTRSQHIHPPGSVRPGFEILPDLLHSHLPPPYSTLPLGSPAPPPPLVPPIIPTIPVGPVVAEDARYVFPLPVIRRSPSERSGKGCCGQWFAGPPLRALIAVVALGGVACAVGGAALGATGLAGPPTSHLTAALLMIGVGIILVTVSGAAWRMTAPGAPPCLGLGTGADLGRCGRRPCSGRAPHGLLYPEFQHRPPPPSYQASMQEYRLRLLLLDRDRQAGVIRGASPPPTYRSNGGSLLRAPLSARCSTSSTIALPNGTSTGGGVGGGGSGTGNGAGSEYSLPPSYRSRHHNSRPPTSIDDDSPANTITSVAGITELPVCISTTDVTITPEQQQQQQQQHHQGRRSSLGMVNNLTISSSLEDVANCTTKVSQINNSAKPVDVQSIDRILKKSMESLSFGDGSGDDSSCLSRKDLVTIVTISGCTDTTEQTSGEMDILAHL